MTTDPNIAIEVTNLGMEYHVYRNPMDAVKELVTRKKSHETITALDGVNFSVRKGEVVGIIGSNGAGKSTALRLISGTLKPTAGEIQVNGRISAILELGTGFHPEFSGRENVLQGGIAMGMSRDEVEAKLDGIISFSGLEDVIDRPFKTYSSGMQARLTFSTAIAVDPDIFIVDEALAAGDAYFVSRSMKRIQQICDSGATVLLVSHATGIVAQLCTRAIWLDRGTVVRDGSALDVTRAYDYSVHVALSDGSGSIIRNDMLQVKPIEVKLEAPAGEAATDEVTARHPASDPVTSLAELAEEQDPSAFRKGPIFMTSVAFLDQSGKTVNAIRRLEALTLRVSYTCDPNDLALITETLGLAIGINRRSDMISVSQFSTVVSPSDEEIPRYTSAPFRVLPGTSGVIEVTIDPVQLAEGEYLFSVGLLPNLAGVSDFYEYHHLAYRLVVLRNGTALAGTVYSPQVRWKHQPER